MTRPSPFHHDSDAVRSRREEHDRWLARVDRGLEHGGPSGACLVIAIGLLLVVTLVALAWWVATAG